MTNRAWGQNMTTGMLGLGVGNATIYRTPQLMASAPDFVEIDEAHYVFGVGRTASGDVYVWGSNANGILGDGTTDSSAHLTPVQVTAVSDIIKIGTIQGSDVLALDSTGDLYGWGENQFGCLGLGDTTRRTSPTLLASGVVDFSGGSNYLVILKSGGVVQSVGQNSLAGNLGTGNSTNATTFQTVTPASGTVTGVYCLTQTTYLLMADGTLMACGDGTFGELGFMPTPIASQDMPNLAAVPNLSSVVHVGRGNRTAYFKLSDDTVWALGNNIGGVLGCGQSFASLNHTTSAPVQVILPSGVTFMSFGQSQGSDSAIALGSDHQAYTWGSGGTGQMGNNGSTATNHTPISVNGLVYVNVVGGGSDQIFAAALDVAPAHGHNFVSIVG